MKINIKKKIISKLQSMLLKIRLAVSGKLGIPVQTSLERRMYRTILDGYIGCDKKLNVFEWGSGFSTVYYAKYLKKNNIDVEWDAVDNNKMWHHRVLQMLKSNNLDNQVTAHLREFPPFWEKEGWGEIPPPRGVFCPKLEAELEYVNMPNILNKKFDIIFVDARFRRHCIEVVKQVLAPNGIIVMHDAQKPHYHVGLEEFSNRKFYKGGAWFPLQDLPNQVWVGSMDNTQVFENLKSFEGGDDGKV